MKVYRLTFSFQSPSMLSLRGPEMEERADRLPPIRQDLVLVTIISTSSSGGGRTLPLIHIHIQLIHL